MSTLSSFEQGTALVRMQQNTVIDHQGKMINQSLTARKRLCAKAQMVGE